VYEKRIENVLQAANIKIEVVFRSPDALLRMPVLHTLSDGSVLRVMGAKEMLAVPVWQGQRILDPAHVTALKAVVGTNAKQLDFGYRIVSREEENAFGSIVLMSYLVDGQHRAAVLRDYFATHILEPDFPVVVLEKNVESEWDVISYFNALNNAKPVKWSDPGLLTNKYIQELEAAFCASSAGAGSVPGGSKKKGPQLIRPGATCRPYLGVEKLRAALMTEAAAGKLSSTESEIKAFVERIVAWNAKAVRDAGLTTVFSGAAGSSKKVDADMIDKAAKLGFMLALDPKLGWIKALL
jgi:hypothetical protein